MAHDYTLLAPAPIGTMRVVLSVASVSAIASASVVARALVGRSCGGCTMAGTIKGSMLHDLNKTGPCGMVRHLKSGG